MSKHPPLIPTGGSEPLLNMSGISQTLPSYPSSTPPEPTFNRSRHITYWLRCARTFLPNAYESGDASRMLFAFFIVSALDLLGLLDPDPVTGKAKITDEEKRGWTDWIYYCQHPGGGFRGFTGTILENGEECAWDLANLPSTFFALCILFVLGDDLSRVRRVSCLQWVKRLQRSDGSFGEVLSGDEIEGGRDLRFCCCAAGILYMLKDAHGVDDDALMFDGPVMVTYVESCQSYEGGFSEGPYREAHSGLNYCAVGALSFYEKVLGHGNEKVLGEDYDLIMERCTKWMVQRQTTYIVEEGDDDSDEEERPTHQTSTLEPSSQDGSFSAHDLLHTGFNGRTNKVADTCYAFWNVGALAILDRQHLIDQDRLRRYLLVKVQHAIGGFGKGVGEPPDVLHAYLGLATLSILGRDGLKELEPTFCISVEAARRVEGAVWKKKP